MRIIRRKMSRLTMSALVGGVLFAAPVVLYAQSLNGTWSCSIQPPNGQGYTQQIQITATTAQVQNGAAVPISFSGAEARFTTVLRNGLTANYVLTAAGAEAHVRLSGKGQGSQAAHSKMALARGEWVHSGRCRR